MSKRQSKGILPYKPATETQAAAGRRNLDAGRKKHHKKMRKAKAKPGYVSAHERWAMLLSGAITVKDLDMDELKRSKLKDSAGYWPDGPNRRTIPSHIAQAMSNERIRRADHKLKSLLDKAVDVLEDYVDGKVEGLKPADQLRAVSMVVERGLGKPDQNVNLTIHEDPWGNLTTAALEDDRIADGEA